MADSYQRGSHQEHVDQFADERATALESLPDKTRIQAKRLLEDLFPLLRKYSYDKLGQQKFSKNRRIAANDRLRIALSYDLPSDEVSQADIQSFCCDPANRDTAIRRAIAKGLLDRILELTLQRIDLSTVPDKREFVVFLGTIVEDQKMNDRFQGIRCLFDISTIDKIIRISDVVLASLADDGDDGDELSVLSDLVSNPTILSLATHLLARILAKREEELQQSEIASTKTFIPASENPILKEWFDTAVNVLRSEAFAEIADKRIIVRILLSLQEGREQIPDLLLPHINSDHSIDAIADIFVSNEAVSAKGAAVTCKSEYLSKLGEPCTIRARAESRLSDPLVQANKRLYAIYKSIVQQQKIYVENAEQEQEWSELSG